MSHKCPDCHIPIPAGQAVIRSISLKRVALCTACAEDRGWISVGSLIGRYGSVSRGVNEAELYANHARR